MVFSLKEEVHLLGRLDRMFQPNPHGKEISYAPFDSTSPYTVFLAGVDFKLDSNFSFIPNIAFVSYDDTSATDLYFKFTMYIRW